MENALSLARTVLVTLGSDTRGGTTCVAQDRDITSGSSSGSIRSRCLGHELGTRLNVTPRKKTRWLLSFDAFRGAETVLGLANFQTLKQDTSCS